MAEKTFPNTLEKRRTAAAENVLSFHSSLPGQIHKRRIADKVALFANVLRTFVQRHASFANITFHSGRMLPQWP